VLFNIRYYKNQAATDEVISVAPDGKGRMFHTGDLGRRDDNGFIKVTGRLKEQYKLENGKYVCPTPIEEAIGMSRFITQVVLCGANRPYNVALLVPELPLIRKEVGADDSVSDDDLVNDDRVRALVDAEIEKTTQKMKKFEVPQAWAFVAPFTAANNMLTPKMSIRRHKVIQTYEELVNSLYGNEKLVTESADAHGAKEHPEKQAA
jgi:long-chain acyl-CoA synthetase